MNKRYSSNAALMDTAQVPDTPASLDLPRSLTS